MVRILVVLSLLASSAFACPKGLKKKSMMVSGAKRIGCADPNGKLQGLGFVRDEKGNLLAVGKFKDNLPDGRWTLFAGSRAVAHPLYVMGTLTDDGKPESDEEGAVGSASH
jgi:hypothetical protein